MVVETLKQLELAFAHHLAPYTDTNTHAGKQCGEAAELCAHLASTDKSSTTYGPHLGTRHDELEGAVERVAFGDSVGRVRMQRLV